MKNKQSFKCIFAKAIIMAIAIPFLSLIPSAKNTYADIVTVSTPEELQTYLTSGGEIKLANNITYTSTATIKIGRAHV